MMVISCDYTDVALSQEWQDEVDGEVLEIFGNRTKVSTTIHCVRGKKKFQGENKKSFGEE